MIFTRGEYAIRHLDVDADAEMLHQWVTAPKAVYWMMQDADVTAVAAEYRRIAAHPHHDAFIGLHRGQPTFLVERYDPRYVEVNDVFEARDGDVGMHFLTAPTDTPVPGFTRAVLTTVMAFLFADPDVQRVVVEPDVRNTAVHRLNSAVGFTVIGPTRLPHKTALLSICTREQFHTAIGAHA